MLSVTDVPYIVFRVLKRERYGSTVSPSDLNRFLALAHAEEVNAMKSQMEVNRGVVDSMRTFVEREFAAAPNGYLSISSLGSTYLSFLGMQRKNGSRWEDCDELTQLEVQDREYNAITKPTVDYPVCYPHGGAIYIEPTPEAGDNAVRISYLRRPNAPRVDAYVNVQKQLVWLGVDDEVESTAIDTDFLAYGWDGVALPLSGTSPAYYESSTVEFEWPDEVNRVNILKRVLVLCGVTVPDELAIQYGAQ